MASEKASSDSTAEQTSSSVLEDDLSSGVRPLGNPEMEAGSPSHGLGEAPASEKNPSAGRSSVSVGNGSSQESQDSRDFFEFLIPNEQKVQVIPPLELPGIARNQKFDLDTGSSANFEEFLDFDRIESLLKVDKKPFRPFSGEFADGIVDQCVRSSLRIEVIDDTAVIEPISSPGAVIIAKKKNNVKEDLEGKKAKKARKRGKGGKIGSESRAEEGSSRVAKRRYSMEEMEDLRFVGGVEEQRKLWGAVYDGLGPVVAREYTGLASSRPHWHGNSVILEGRSLGIRGGSVALVFLVKLLLDLENPTIRLSLPHPTCYKDLKNSTTQSNLSQPQYRAPR